MIMNKSQGAACAQAGVVIVMSQSSNVISVVHMLLLTMCVLDTARIHPNITLLQGIPFSNAQSHYMTLI